MDVLCSDNFGVILYELLTGERLFKGKDISETLAQVLTKQPDLERIPAKARRLLKECLEQNPKHRLRDIGDAKRLIDEVPDEPAPARARFTWAGWVVAVLAVGLLFWHPARPVEEPLKPLVRLNFDLGLGVSLGSRA